MIEKRCWCPSTSMALGTPHPNPPPQGSVTGGVFLTCCEVRSWRGTGFSPLGHEVIGSTVFTEGPPMPRRMPLDAWTEQVVDAFPKLSRPQATVLALYSFGMILAQRCGSAASPWPWLPFWASASSHFGPASRSSINRPRPSRGRIATNSMSPSASHRCWRWILKGFVLSTRAVALSLDATSRGDRFTVLSISVVYRGKRHPRGLERSVARQRRASWKPEWLSLLDAFSELVPPGWTCCP